MSKYTMQVRFICEALAGYDDSQGFDAVNQIIEESRNAIFTNYPIFDEAYRAVLERKILMHFYTREICEETFGLWKLRLATRMNEIMPLYNQYYTSSLREFDPFIDVDLSTTRIENSSIVGEDAETLNETNAVAKSGSRDVHNKGTTSEAGSSGNSTLGMGSDTPQGGIENFGTTTAYLTNITKDSEDRFENNVSATDTKGVETYDEANSGSKRNSRSKNTNNNRNDSGIEKISGKRGSQTYAQMLMELRESFINIDMMIIDNLRDLFFILYD